MSNIQIIHFHFTLALKPISFLEVSNPHNLINADESLVKFKTDYKKGISDKLDDLIALLKAKKEALVYFSASFLEMLEKTDPAKINTLKKFIGNNQLALVGSCAYHSLSYFCHPALFKKEVAFLQQAYKSFFNTSAALFVNTACLFDDKLIEHLAQFNFKAVIAAANNWHLSGAQATGTFRSVGNKPLQVLLANGDSTNNSDLTLINGYGSHYEHNIIGESSLSDLNKLMLNTKDASTYSASMPLSSPEWELPIASYLSNPMQKALLNECKRLVDKLHKQLSDEDWKTIMLLCQPQKLLEMNRTTDDGGYQAFINGMNILTAIGLRY